MSHNEGGVDTPSEADSLRALAARSDELRAQSSGPPAPQRAVFEPPPMPASVREGATLQRPGATRTAAQAHADRLRQRTEAVRRVLPARYAGLDLANPEVERRVQRRGAIAFVTEHLDAPGLTFMGPSGAGKTTLACAALPTYVRERGGSPMFVAARELAQARALHSLGDGEPALVERAMRADVLILDDLGIEEHATRSAVPDVIDERYDRQLVTWVTTGLTVEAITQRYGAGRARRIFEDPVVIVRCGAERSK